MDVSVIIPMSNICEEIDGIVKSLVEDNPNVSIEIIAVDMASEDKTMVDALSALKNNNVSGCVLQGGKTSIGNILNMGLKKSTGDYITFVFPRKLYTKHISCFYLDAFNNKADFVFFSKGMNKYDFNQSVMNKIVMEQTILGKISVDIACLMISASTVRDKRVYFSEDLTGGYSEEFIYNILLNSNNIYISDDEIERNTQRQAQKKGTLPEMSFYFDKISALKRVKETITLYHPNYINLIDMINGARLPSVMFLCIECMLKNNLSTKEIKDILDNKNLNGLITVNKYTDAKLKRKIYVWRLLPKLYLKIYKKK